jgi:hypothetical protein
MPPNPKLEIDDIDTAVGRLKSYTYQSSNETGVFLVTYMDLRTELGEDRQEQLINGVRDAFVEGSSSVLASDGKITLRGHKGREFISRTTDEGVKIVFKSKIILVGRRLYQIAAGTSEANSASPEVAKFLTSFDLEK